ncbi:hypothetical protein [Flagellimonas halotolerans]|mgnify:CR=1 FL=1|nr:hypothetical protein [Muricauda sp. SYSU M84420]
MSLLAQAERKFLESNPAVFMSALSRVAVTNAQRTQDWNESVFTYNKIIQTYRSYQYDQIEVPRVAVQERADFVLKSINSK